MKNLDRSFFHSEMGKLQEQFQRAVYSQRKSDLIYLAIKHVDEKQLASIMDFFIAESKFAPNVQDFKDRARVFASQKEKVDCDKCSGGGLVSRYYKKTGVNYAFSCTCMSGYDYPAFQKWANQNHNLFALLPPRRLGVENPYEGMREEYEKTASPSRYDAHISRSVKFNKINN